MNVRVSICRETLKALKGVSLRERESEEILECERCVSKCENRERESMLFILLVLLFLLLLQIILWLASELQIVFACFVV